MTKKIGLGALALLVLSAVYYYTVGSSQLIEEMKSQVHNELSTLKKNGFGVQEKLENEKREHIVVSFDDPEKIASFLRSRGMQINKYDVQALKGLKLAIDLEYLPKISTALALDIYPTALPKNLDTFKTDKKEKKLLTQLQRIIDKKAILIHMEINKQLTELNGSMKDIDETFQVDKNFHLTVNGFTFLGKFKNNKLNSIKQNLKDIQFQIANEMDIKISNLESDYVVIGTTPYDYTIKYTLKKAILSGKDNVNLEADNILLDSLSTYKNGLLYTEAKTITKSFDIKTEKKSLHFENILFDIQVDNIDAKAIEVLQNTDINNQAEVNRLLKQLLSKGIVFKVPTFSIAKINKNGHLMNGFKLDAKFAIDKNFNIAAVNTNPMTAMEKITAKIHIVLSNDLFALIAQQPQAMMALMLFQPKDLGKEKAYIIELKKGQLLVNGNPVL